MSGNLYATPRFLDYIDACNSTNRFGDVVGNPVTECLAKLPVTPETLEVELERLALDTEFRINKPNLDSVPVRLTCYWAHCGYFVRLVLDLGNIVRAYEHFEPLKARLIVAQQCQTF